MRMEAQGDGGPAQAAGLEQGSFKNGFVAQVQAVEDSDRQHYGAGNLGELWNGTQDLHSVRLQAL
jgi:hypothetical protein